MKYDDLKRLLAAVLCLCMVLSTVPAPAFAVESETAPQADTPITQDGILAVVGACSDFQYNSTKYQGTTYADKYAANAAHFIGKHRRKGKGKQCRCLNIAPDRAKSEYGA